MEDDARLREFNEQMEKSHFQSNIQSQEAQGSSPQGLQQSSDQSLIERAQINPGMPPSEIGTSFGRCPQCNTFHPPMNPGEKCPVAPIKTEKGDVVDLNPFFAQLKNIVTSQIDSKGIKDVDKMMKHVVVNLTQFLEGYNE